MGGLSMRMKLNNGLLHVGAGYKEVTFTPLVNYNKTQKCFQCLAKRRMRAESRNPEKAISKHANY